MVNSGASIGASRALSTVFALALGLRRMDDAIVVSLTCCGWLACVQRMHKAISAAGLRRRRRSNQSSPTLDSSGRSLRAATTASASANGRDDYEHGDDRDHSDNGELGEDLEDAEARERGDEHRQGNGAGQDRGDDQYGSTRSAAATTSRRTRIRRSSSPLSRAHRARGPTRWDPLSPMCRAFSVTRCHPLIACHRCAARFLSPVVTPTVTSAHANRVLPDA